MGEHTFRVSLGDIKTIRVTCKRCGGTVEATAEKLTDAYRKGKCPLCGVAYQSDENADVRAISDLHTALVSLQGASKLFDVEFPIRLPSAD